MKTTIEEILMELKKKSQERKEAFEKKKREFEQLEKALKKYREEEAIKEMGMDMTMYLKTKSTKFKVFNNKYKEVLKKIKNWMEKEYKDRCFLVMYGNYGTGKTLLARKIAIINFEKGRSVYFIAKKDFDNHITDFEKKDINEYIEKLKNVDVLIIDDILSGYLTDYRFSQLFGILDYRYLREKETIITANEDLLNFNYPKGNSDWERLQDRLYEVGYFVEFNMMSYRRMKHQITSNK